MKVVALGQVAEIERRGVNPSSLASSTPYLGLEHIERGGRIISTSTIGESDVTSTKFSFSPEHLLFGKLRPNLAKISRPTFSGVCSTDVVPIRPGKDLDRSFLAWYLLQPSMVQYAAIRTSGANLPRLSPTMLASFPVPLPALDEQRRIAAILDAADAIREKRRQVLARLNRLAQSVFHELFGDPSTWTRIWPMGTIDDLAPSVQYGTSSKSGSVGEWPTLRMGNVTDDGRLDLSDLKYSDLVVSDVPKYSVRRGDLLFNRTNSKEKVGKSAVIATDEPLAIAGYLIRVRFDDPATAHYVCAYLIHPHGLAVRRQMAKSAVNQANINATEMRRIAIAMPPLDLQREFAAQVEAINAQRAAVERALALDNELFASLQHRAFRGEL